MCYSMSIFYGHSDDKITEEDLNSHISKRVSLTRLWTYAGLTGVFRYPINPKVGFPSSLIMISNPPTRNAVLTIVEAHIDNDGVLGSGDILEFQLRYITMPEGSTTKTTNEKTVLTVDLWDYVDYEMSDGQGKTHNFNFLSQYNLSENITNYMDIRALSLGARQARGWLQGNELMGRRSV